jgi:hypothetical protein
VVTSLGCADKYKMEPGSVAFDHRGRGGPWHCGYNYTIVVKATRGSMVDEEALIAVLPRGHVAAAGRWYEKGMFATHNLDDQAGGRRLRMLVFK